MDHTLPGGLAALCCGTTSFGGVEDVTRARIAESFVDIAMALDWKGAHRLGSRL